MNVGDSVQFRAYYDQNAEFAEREPRYIDVTNSASWSSSNSNVSINRGLVAGQSVGSASIYASYEKRQDSASVNIVSNSSTCSPGETSSCTIVSSPNICNQINTCNGLRICQSDGTWGNCSASFLCTTPPNSNCLSSNPSPSQTSIIQPSIFSLLTEIKANNNYNVISISKNDS